MYETLKFVILKNGIHRLVVLFMVFMIFSCKYYNEKQLELINKIAKENSVGIPRELNKDIGINFTQKEIVNLTNHDNPYVRASFFKFLSEQYPQYCYNVILQHLNDTKSVQVHTSYDTIEGMTIAEYMIWKTQNSEFITNEQRGRLNDLIVFNYRNYPHLNEQAYLILRLGLPKFKYYQFVKDLVIEKLPEFKYDKILLISYLAKFKKAEDIGIIKRALQIVSQKWFDQVERYDLYELIRRYPDNEYYSILVRIYEVTIKNKKLRCDECYCDIEQYCKALVMYPSPKTILMLTELINSNNFENLCNHLANKEQIYYLLKKSNNVVYQPLIKSLENKINIKVYNEIVRDNRFTRER